MEKQLKEYSIQEGEAAFYGPKLDFEVRAADGKNLTIATIQLDFVLPQKFGLKYVDKEEKEQVPVIIHHSPFGSYQRFIALLLEQTGGKFPFWLVPCQIAILPANKEKEVEKYCEKLARNLTKKDLRVKIFSKKSPNYYIRQVYEKKIPYYLLIGKKEIEAEKKILKLVSVYLEGQREELTENELINKLTNENKVVDKNQS